MMTLYLICSMSTAVLSRRAAPKLGAAGRRAGGLLEWAVGKSLFDVGDG
jgi:hypothetical protein